MTHHHTSPTAALCCLALSLAAFVQAAHATPTPGTTPDEITPELTQAIHDGLAWLAKQQQPDGSFGGDSPYGRHVGITGLAGLAFMSDGNLPGRGPYGSVVEGCVRFILNNSTESGLLAAETSHGPMYGHGFATLFLAEVYGSTREPTLREKLRRAVRLIVATQNDEGGWRYQPVRKDADISVTICQVMALRAARNAGIYVEKTTIDRAVEYVRNCQNNDGGFRYMINTGPSAFARSAAGVAALQYSGIYTGPDIERGLQYIRQFTPPQEHRVPHYFYGHYYAAQAMYLAGDQHWRAWWPVVRTELITKQTGDGSWHGQAGSQYGTAMALIALQTNKGLLPIFQR